MGGKRCLIDGGASLMQLTMLHSRHGSLTIAMDRHYATVSTYVLIVAPWVESASLKGICRTLG